MLKEGEGDWRSRQKDEAPISESREGRIPGATLFTRPKNTPPPLEEERRDESTAPNATSGKDDEDEDEDEDDDEDSYKGARLQKTGPLLDPNCSTVSERDGSTTPSPL